MNIRVNKIATGLSLIASTVSFVLSIALIKAIRKRVYDDK